MTAAKDAPMPSDSKRLELKEVAECLGLPANTVRRWSVRFSPLLSSNGRSGWWMPPTYSAADVEMLADILHHLIKGSTVEQVLEALQPKVASQLATGPFSPAARGDAPANEATVERKRRRVRRKRPHRRIALPTIDGVASYQIALVLLGVGVVVLVALFLVPLR